MINIILKNLDNPFEMRDGERIVDLDKYIENLERCNIKYTKEQYEDFKINNETERENR
ncbi:hypothetical protein PMY12_08805 [Clostridium tertium]|jgi:hypothetical protein|uniref:hypothetical protein n=1 Tax=Clostridium tertium TaxID=1559 RepID=UPI00232B826F|nr:hypothetical protein [Clostridium tertium]MDB1934013.1 hypothetical protein [Clostridium tertium]MDB1937112.1 hypothetical protein [Clostridium tertium]